MDGPEPDPDLQVVGLPPLRDEELPLVPSPTQKVSDRRADRDVVIARRDRHRLDIGRIGHLELDPVLEPFFAESNILNVFCKQIE